MAVEVTDRQADILDVLVSLRFKNLKQYPKTRNRSYETPINIDRMLLLLCDCCILQISHFPSDREVSQLLIFYVVAQ